MTDNQELTEKELKIELTEAQKMEAVVLTIEMYKQELINKSKQLTQTQQALDSAVEALKKIQKTNDFHGFADFTALRTLKKINKILGK